MLNYIEKNLDDKLEDVEDKVVQIAWIKGYEGYYKIDSKGNVWSYHCGKAKKIKTFLGGSGTMYKRVELCVKGKSKKFYLHRLLAEAFIPKIEGKNFINHIDGNRLNNDLSNLEWCTLKENAQHYWQVIRDKKKSENKTSGCLVQNSDLGLSEGLGYPSGINLVY
ncbi:HNH endonuclease signature motif containing protein [Gemella morbillorum]|uniref:HNH endonuclease signature motif containing protein n=1 Tax=Gemella morbillorum TaxID=29391 RepID=UPI00248E882B|nr:HNH endonuclease signature motif containing protein [Gemella morbillorum]